MAEKKDRILLFGYGNYGEKIAKQLAQNGYDVYIAENDKENLKKASKDGFENLLVVDFEDDEQLTNILFDYGFYTIFCSYDDEERNVYLTITFKALFRHVEVVAICESKENERKLKLAGADKIIDTMVAAANRLYFVIEKPAVAEAIDHILFKDKDIVFKEITIPKGSFLDGVNIKKINFKKDFHIILIGVIDKEITNRFTFVTRGIDHELNADDVIVIIGRKKDIEKFEEKLFAKEER